MAENEVVEGEDLNEPAAVIEEPAQEGLTQEQVDAIVSQRVNEVREQSAAELRQMRESAEAAIAGYREALNEVRAQRGGQAQDNDDPAPANMTQDQKIMWDANKPNRIWQKQQMEASREETRRATAPLVNDRAVAAFFAGKAVPDSVKAATQALFAESVGDSKIARSMSPDQIVQASYIRACAQHAEDMFSGKVKQSTAKPQPRVVAPNGSESLGGGTRPLGIGRVGGNKTSQTWQEIQADLIAKGHFPED